MSDPNWLESRNKRNLKFYVGILLIIFIAGAVFFYNNREVFLRKAAPATVAVNSHADCTALQSPKAKEPTERKTDVLKPQQAAAVAPSHPPRDTQPVVSHQEAAQSLDSVFVTDIPCVLRCREGIKVVLSLELKVNQGAFKKEVLLKRDNLKVMVQKVVSAKTLDELVVDSLRNQSKQAMNRILDGGAISDVIFRNFRIEKVQ